MRHDDAHYQAGATLETTIGYVQIRGGEEHMERFRIAAVHSAGSGSSRCSAGVDFLFGGSLHHPFPWDVK